MNDIQEHRFSGCLRRIFRNFANISDVIETASINTRHMKHQQCIIPCGLALCYCYPTSSAHIVPNKHGIVAEVEFINNVAKSESENVLHEKNEAYTIFIWEMGEKERERVRNIVVLLLMKAEKFKKPDKVRLLHFTLFVRTSLRLAMCRLAQIVNFTWQSQRVFELGEKMAKRNLARVSW